MSLRVIFMGTPEFAVPALLEVMGHGHEVVAVYTRAPRPAGRGLEPRPSAMEREARRLGIPVFTPPNLRSDADQQAFRELDADIAVVVAYGVILPEAVLTAPRLGCINLHASLLPRWRGAAPIQRAIMAGDQETGVMVMRMERGLDTGPIGMVEKISITPQQTAGELHDQLSRLGADLLARALAALERDALTFRPQPEQGVIYADKIEKSETQIDWSRPAREVHDHIRGLSPFPGAWFDDDGTRIKVLRSEIVEGHGSPGTRLAGTHLTIACTSNAIRILTLQPAGKSPMGSDAFLRGR